MSTQIDSPKKKLEEAIERYAKVVQAAKEAGKKK